MSLVADPIRITFEDVARLGRGANGFANRIYLHWTGGHYGHVYDDYHISIDWDGTLYVPPGGAGADALTLLREHTWHRNTGAIGIAICGAYDAVARSSTDINFGPEPPTGCQVEYLAKAVGILCPALGLALSPRTVLTHCEAAFKMATDLAAAIRKPVGIFGSCRVCPSARSYILAVRCSAEKPWGTCLGRLSDCSCLGTQPVLWSRERR